MSFNTGSQMMKGLQKVTSHAWLTCNTVEDSWASATDCYFFRCLLSDHISFWVSRHAGLSCRIATPKAHLQQGILTRRMNEWTIVQKQRKSRVRVVVVTKGDKPEREIHYQTKGLSCLNMLPSECTSVNYGATWWDDYNTGGPYGVGGDQNASNIFFLSK